MPQPNLNTQILSSEFLIQVKHWRASMMMMLSFLFGFFVINKQMPDLDIDQWGVYFLIRTFALEIMIIPIIVALYSATATVRDYESGFSEIVYSGAVNLKNVYWYRYLIMTILCLLVYISFAMGILSGLTLYENVAYGQATLALSWSLVILLIPNLLLISTMMFAIGLCARKFFAGHN